MSTVKSCDLVMKIKSCESYDEDPSSSVLVFPSPSAEAVQKLCGCSKIYMGYNMLSLVKI